MASFDFNPTATRYEPANAHSLGRAAKLAYSGAAAAQARAAEWGLGKFHFFDHQETRGFPAPTTRWPRWPSAAPSRPN